MSTSAAFFVGKGNNAEFLIGHRSDGYPQEKSGNGVPKSLLRASNEVEFRTEVQRHFSKIEEDDRMVADSTTTWASTKGYSYVYAYFGGHVWVTTGGNWFNPFIRTKHPNAPPPQPVGRRGEMEGNIRVQCGNCFNSNKVTIAQLARWVQKHSDAVRTWDGFIESYFESKGFAKVRGTGWTCNQCKVK